MSLPELDWQIIYGRLGWAVVLATLAVTLWPRVSRLGSRPGQRAVALLLLGAAGLQWLPGAAAPSYWLGLAFQLPSALLVGFCLVRLNALRQRAALPAPLPLGLAAGMAFAGATLYLEAIGYFSTGFYYWGFSPAGAPVLALLAAAGCAAAAVTNRARPYALAGLFAVAAFSVLRLPTGNLWDAFLDPLLWGWALLSLGARCRRWWVQQQRRGMEAREPVFETEPSLEAARVAGAEHF